MTSPDQDLNLGDWNRGLAEAIQALDSPRFAPSLARALRRVAPFDYTVSFAYQGEERPLDPL